MNLHRSIECNIHVEFKHRVFFTSQLFLQSNPILRKILVDKDERLHQLLVIVDEAVTKTNPSLVVSITQYFQKSSSNIKLVAPPILLPGGEAEKSNYSRVKELYSLIQEYGLCRHSYILGIGGGALLDLIGFAAATAHRGIRHIRVPTTTLSQGDASVGIKNSVNLFGKKNFIGTFAPPFAVINDSEFLRTLPRRYKRSGYSEAVKVALIRDASFFEYIEQQADHLHDCDDAVIQQVIRRCAELHVQHISTSGDPYELGSARPLDFGHWSAHKLEQLSSFRITHGEAVAFGIALDTMYSAKKGWLTEKDADRVLQLLSRLGFPLFYEEALIQDQTGSPEILNGLKEFREHLGGKLTITQLKGIGKGFEVHDMDAQLLMTTLEALRTYSQKIFVPA
jgi:3-dehydroquinate synthase